MVYPLPVFEQMTGLGKAALRSARRAGLMVRYVSGRGWVLGRDWIDFVVEQGQTEGDERRTKNGLPTSN